VPVGVSSGRMDTEREFWPHRTGPFGRRGLLLAFATRAFQEHGSGVGYRDNISEVERNGGDVVQVLSKTWHRRLLDYGERT